MIDYTEYVNIKQGTASEPRFSTGNTLPHVAAPFGMNSFCIQTKGSADGWFYHPSHKHCEGVRLTHQPSPWVRDYGHFVFMPQSGDVYVIENERSSGYDEIALKPAFAELYFKRYSSKMCVAPTDRGAVSISANQREVVTNLKVSCEKWQDISSDKTHLVMGEQTIRIFVNDGNYFEIEKA